MATTRSQMTRSSKAESGISSEIPDKLYFKIGEVSFLVGVQPHVLRYWEKEVAAIRPGKTASNQRRYRRKDVELFREIRRLLYEEKYTLAGARKRLTTPEKPIEPEDFEASAPGRLKAIAESQEDALSADGQMLLGFHSSTKERLERIREGLLELIAISADDA